MRLRDKVAIVTGSAQGIGQGIAQVFAGEGARLVLADVQEDKVAAVAAAIEADGGQAVSLGVDVGVEEQVRAMVELARERYGRLDVLVNNAGIGLWKRVDEVEMDDYDKVVDTNLRGMFLGCRLGVPLMEESGGGSIISIASVHGILGWPGQSVYAATKAAIIGSTRAMASDLAEADIRVNAISPGAIWLEHFAPQELTEEEWAMLQEEFGDRVRDFHRYAQPMPRVGETRDIAHCALYLASDESVFVTGQNIAVDGGMTTAMSWEQPADRHAKIKDSRAELEAWIAKRKEARGE